MLLNEEKNITLNAEKPFEFGVHVPIKNTRMLDVNRFDKIAADKDFSATDIFRITNNLAPFLGKKLNGVIVGNDKYFPPNLFDGVKQIVGPDAFLVGSTPNPNIRIFSSKDKSMIMEAVCKINTGSSDNKDIKLLELMPHRFKSFYGLNVKQNDIVIFRTLPYHWDNFSGTELLNDTNAIFYSVMPANLNVLNHANATTIYGASTSTEEIQILSDFSDRDTFLKEFGTFRFSFYYKFFNSNGGDLTAFIEAVDIKGDPTSLDALRKKKFTVISGSDQLTWKLFETSFSLDVDDSFWSVAVVGNKLDINKIRIGFFNKEDSAPTAGGGEMQSAVVYPIIEFAPYMDQSNGFVKMSYSTDDENASTVSFKILENKKILKKLNGDTVTFDPTDNYIRYQITARFKLIDVRILEQLLNLQSWNRENWDIVFRPYVKELPPVLIGDLQITNINYNIPDATKVDFQMRFIEN